MHIVIFLICRSACVYSRKVEYLYQLVFRVMDIIADRQRDQNDDPNRKEADPEQIFGSEPQFIALDDIPEAKSSTIDLVERDDQATSSAISQAQSPLLLTMSLDADMDDTGDPNKDFRLASASIHSSGALLLDARFASFLDGNLGRRSTWGVASSVEKARTGDQSPLLSLIAQDQGMNAVGCSPDKLAMDGIPEFEPEEDYNNVSDAEDAYLDSEDKDLRQSTMYNGDPSTHDRCDGRPPPATSKEDVWCMLNPHEDTSAREKPLRKGKTSRRPKIDCKVQDFDTKMCWAQLSIRSHQTRSLRLPYFPDFSSHFIQERNKKLAQKLADARARTVSLSSESMHQLGLMLNLDAGVRPLLPPTVFSELWKADVAEPLSESLSLSAFEAINGWLVPFDRMTTMKWICQALKASSSTRRVLAMPSTRTRMTTARTMSVPRWSWTPENLREGLGSRIRASGSMARTWSKATRTCARRTWKSTSTVWMRFCSRAALRHGSANGRYGRQEGRWAEGLQERQWHSRGNLITNVVRRGGHWGTLVRVWGRGGAVMLLIGTPHLCFQSCLGFLGTHSPAVARDG